MLLPQKLYHYTSINNLALILQSRSIRFGRLDKVNDPTEGLASDFQSMAHYIFISSWTANEIEDFALWNMYTPSMRGVRIELPVPLFPSFNIGNKISNCLVSDQEYVDYKKGYFIVGAENTPVQIIYSDDKNLLYPPIKVKDGLHLKTLSKYKRLIWRVEQEYRYQLNIVPIDQGINPEQVGNSYSRFISKNIAPPMDSYFLKLSNEAFTNMKIRLSPRLLAGDKTIIDALVQSFNPSARVEDSVSSGLIR